MRKKEDSGIKYTLDQVNTMELNTDWDIFVYMYLTGMYSNLTILKAIGKSSTILYSDAIWKAKYKKLLEDIPYTLGVRRVVYNYDVILNHIDSTLINEDKLLTHDTLYKWLKVSWYDYNDARKILEEKYGEYIIKDYTSYEEIEEGGLYVDNTECDNINV